MNFRKLSGLALGSVLVVGMSAGAAFAQQDTSARQDMHNAGQDTKNAAKDTGHGIDKGSHKAYNSTKYHTKKAYHSTKYHTKKTAHKIHRKVDPDTPPSN